MGNQTKFHINNTCWGMISMLTTGSVLQTFLLENGLQEDTTNVISSVMLGFQLLTILIYSNYVDRQKDVLDANRKVYYLYFPLPVVLTLMCLLPGHTPWWLWALMLLSCALLNIGIGFSNVLCYKFPYKILDMRKYGNVMSVDGIISGIFCLALSSLIPVLQAALGYHSTMTVIFPSVMVILIVAMVTCRSMKPLPDAKLPEPTPGSKVSVLKFKNFTHLIGANIMRGFTTGIMGTAVTIGYYFECLDSSSSSILVLLTYLVLILGCGLYALVANRVKVGTIILIASICVAVLIPLMLIQINTVTFLLFYALAFLFKTAIDYSVPVAVTKLTSYDTVGQYSSGRMLLSNIGSIFASLICIPLVKLIGGIPTLLIAGASQLICGICYFIRLRKGSITD